MPKEKSLRSLSMYPIFSQVSFKSRMPVIDELPRRQMHFCGQWRKRVALALIYPLLSKPFILQLKVSQARCNKDGTCQSLGFSCYKPMNTCYYNPCRMDSECPGAYKCKDNGVCANVDCKEHSECPGGEVCYHGECIKGVSKVLF